MSDKRNTFEKVVRFVCGAIFGLLIGSIGVISPGPVDDSFFLVVVVSAALNCGLLAITQGDRFWMSLGLAYIQAKRLIPRIPAQ